MKQSDIEPLRDAIHAMFDCQTAAVSRKMQSATLESADTADDIETRVLADCIRAARDAYDQIALANGLETLHALHLKALPAWVRMVDAHRSQPITSEPDD